MGISSDGMLYFGFPIGEEDQHISEFDFVEESDEEFDDIIIREAGLRKWEETTEGEDRDNWRKDCRKAQEECPVDLKIYCSYDYPMHMLVARGLTYSVSGGYYEEIDPEKLKVPQDNIDAMKKWCDDHKIEWQEPKWLLCSLYG